MRRRGTVAVRNAPRRWAASYLVAAHVHHAHRLALAAGDRAWLEQLDANADPGRLAQRVLLAPGQAGALALASEDQFIQGPRPLEHELVVRPYPVDGEQDALDLGGIQVDAADDEHVVAASAHRAHPGQRAPARARLQRERRDVAGAVAQQRQRLLRERGEHQFAVASGWQRRTGDGVDDLDEEVVLVDVETVARLRALGRYAGSHDLRQSIDVERDQAQLALELFAHRLGPRLRAEHPDLEGELAGIDALLAQ